MGSFTNDMGGFFGGSMYGSKANNWSNDEWKALMGTDKPDNYWDQINQENVAQLSNPSADPDKNKYDMGDLKVNAVAGQPLDNTLYDSIQAELTGGSSLNWESKKFGQLNDEQLALKPKEIGDLQTAWKKHGDDLKTESETFKKALEKAITGKWKGDTAEAAEAASKHVTHNSIYDFTPSSDEIANRLEILKGAFEHIQKYFPHYTEHKLVNKFTEKTKADLDKDVSDYNSKYHFDSEGHLLLSNGHYVDVQTAIDEAERIKQSIKDYQEAVQLFRDTYNPTVQAIAQNFPTLPAPPNMKFEDPTAPGGPKGPGVPGGPGGPGTSSPFSPGGGAGFKPLDKSALDKLNANKPTDLEKYQPTDQKPIDQKDLTTDPTKDALESLTDPAKSAMDTATNAAKDAAGQLADAMKNAAGQNPLGDMPKGPPEGVLGLGPQGLGGAGAGKGGGGVGGGVPLRGMPSGLSSSAPATAAVKMPAAAAGTGAGLGAGAGSPGAGAPAAGQRAGDQNGKGHQVNKALRRKKNGKDVMGDSEASVPVVGADEEAEQSENARPEQPESRRRIPQRGTTWQPDSAVQPGPASPARGQQFTPGRSE